MRRHIYNGDQAAYNAGADAARAGISYRAVTLSDRWPQSRRQCRAMREGYEYGESYRKLVLERSAGVNSNE